MSEKFDSESGNVRTKVCPFPRFISLFQNPPDPLRQVFVLAFLILVVQEDGKR